MSNFVANHYKLRLEHEGYKPIRTSLEKEVKVVPIVVGLFIWPVLLWTYGPKAYHFYEMQVAP